jgi:F-type H+-transporting ATPase subunit delta
MRDHRIGRRYAQALFETALKYDMVRSVEDDLAGIAALLDKDPEFSDFLVAPYTSREEKIGILDRMFSDRITALTMQTLRVLLVKRREAEIASVRDEYVALRRAHEGAVYVHVTSAEMMDDEQRAALLAKLNGSLGKNVEADFDIDPLMIGGVRVAYDGNVIDGTARGSLIKLREHLTYDLLKRVG